MNRVKLLILGAGPTGLGAALHASDCGETDCLVLEASQNAGGLATSVMDRQGFTWDLGAHVQFSHYAKHDEFLERALAANQWVTHRRSTWIWTKQRFVPYPYQRNLHHLRKEERWAALRGLLQVQKTPKKTTEHFADWITHTFGDGISEQFLRPYNEKIWAVPLETMSADWVAERVAAPDWESVLESLCFDRDQSGWGPNATFRYPLHGGTGAIWHSLAARLPPETIRYGQRIVSVDVERKVVHTAGGERFAYESLISTLPLDMLTAMTTPAGRIPSAARLTSTTTHVVGLGMSGTIPDSLKGKCWIYFPDAEQPFYRLTVFSNLSPHNVPDARRHWSVMAEIAETPHRPLPSEDVVELVRKGLRRTGLLPPSAKIISVWKRRMSRGYPVPTRDRDPILHDVLPALAGHGIYSRGRFGAWKYEVSNQDHSVMQGVEAVERILHGRPEQTVFQPDLVNRRHNPFPFPEWNTALQKQGA